MKIDEQKLNPGLPKLNKTFFRKPKKEWKIVKTSNINQEFLLQNHKIVQWKIKPETVTIPAYFLVKIECARAERISSLLSITGCSALDLLSGGLSYNRKLTCNKLTTSCKTKVKHEKKKKIEINISISSLTLLRFGLPKYIHDFIRKFQFDEKNVKNKTKRQSKQQMKCGAEDNFKIFSNKKDNDLLDGWLGVVQIEK